MSLKKYRGGFVQFSEVEEIIRQLLSSYEGKCLNENDPFDHIMPTQENLGDVLASKLSKRLFEDGWELKSLEIGENPTRRYIVEIKDLVHTHDKEGIRDIPGLMMDESCGIDHMTGSGTFDKESIVKKNQEEFEASHLSETAKGVYEPDGYRASDVSREAPVGADDEPYRKESSEGDITKGAVSNNADLLCNDLDCFTGKHTDVEASNESQSAAEISRRTRNRRKRLNNTVYMLIGITVLLIAAILIIVNINRHGSYPWGSDSWYHLFKGHMLYLSIREGDVYPLYSDIWYNGIQPLRYWAPLPHYVLAVFEMVTNGNIALSYNLFIAFVFIIGGIGWLLWGIKADRRVIACILAVLWTLLPDNLRVLFSEGNLSRVAVTALFPYLLLAVSGYLGSFDLKRRKAVMNDIQEISADGSSSNHGVLYGDPTYGKYQMVNLGAIALLMVLITFCHAMIAAMVAVTVTLFSVIYGIAEKKMIRSTHVILATACGIAAAGIWLVPALSGGLLSMDSEAVKELAEGLTYPVMETLNPVRRIDDPNVFYFGTSIFAAAVFGMLFGGKKTRIAFAVTLIIFTGTTKILLPIILKLPLSQAFWMMRFTPLAMGTFFAGMLYWKKLNRKLTALILILVIADSAVSFSELAHNSEMPKKTSEILQTAAVITNNRIALLDNSRMGSFPSFYLSFNESDTITKQVFGSGWQGALTAQNIMLLNTAVENKWYDYMFDRCLEYGSDVVVITREMIDDPEEVICAADKAGYILINRNDENKSFGDLQARAVQKREIDKILKAQGIDPDSLASISSSEALIFKYPADGVFGTIVRYSGIGIGRYASNLSLVFPQLETGVSHYVDDYTLEELSEYDVIYLSGFSFRRREDAEEMIRVLSEKGIRVVIDLTNADVELLSSRAGFLGVLAESAIFEGTLPKVDTAEGEIYFKNDIPEEIEKWRTIYLENLDSIQAATYYDEHQMDIVGTKINENIVFVGMNLPYFALLTGDKAAIELLEDILSLDAGAFPERKVARLDVETGANTIRIKSDYTNVNTGIAALDTLRTESGEYRVSHNLVKMLDNELTLTVGYPQPIKGVAVSVAGVAGLAVLMILLRRKGGGGHCTKENTTVSG